MTQDYLALARDAMSKSRSYDPMPETATCVGAAVNYILRYLEGMEAVTNRPTIGGVAQEGRAYEPNPKTPPAQETWPSVECPTCKAANNPANRNCAHCRSSLFGVTQETTTDACLHTFLMCSTDKQPVPQDSMDWRVEETAWCTNCGQKLVLGWMPVKG